MSVYYRNPVDQKAPRQWKVGDNGPIFSRFNKIFSNNAIVLLSLITDCVCVCVCIYIYIYIYVCVCVCVCDIY